MGLVLKPLNLSPPGTECGVGLTLLTPTQYIFGMTVHRRLSTDTHMSPLAGRLCSRATRQRYLRGPKFSVGLWGCCPSCSLGCSHHPSHPQEAPRRGSPQRLLVRRHSLPTSRCQEIVERVSVEQDPLLPSAGSLS